MRPRSTASCVQYQERVFRLVLRMIGDRAEAEDLAQEVFISIFKAIEGFRGTRSSPPGSTGWRPITVATASSTSRGRRQLTDNYDDQSDEGGPIFRSVPIRPTACSRRSRPSTCFKRGS